MGLIHVNLQLYEQCPDLIHKYSLAVIHFEFFRLSLLTILGLPVSILIGPIRVQGQTKGHDVWLRSLTL